MKKIYLIFAACTVFWALSAVPSQAAVTQGGVANVPEGTQVKQGWVCKRALLYYRRAWRSYSQIKFTDGAWWTLYDNGFESMGQGASDNYLHVCAFFVGSGFNYMYTY